MFKVPEQQTQKRLAAWRQLRQHLETSKSPFDDVAAFFNQFPKTKIYTDPYDQSTWPTAWELIEENEYCPINILLGMCYTLQLCDRFEKIKPKITISLDKSNNSIYYLLILDDLVYGIEDDRWVSKEKLPKSLKHIKIYEMPPIH